MIWVPVGQNLLADGQGFHFVMHLDDNHIVVYAIYILKEWPWKKSDGYFF